MGIRWGEKRERCFRALRTKCDGEERAVGQEKEAGYLSAPAFKSPSFICLSLSDLHYSVSEVSK